MNGKAHQLGRIATVLALVASVTLLAAQSAAALDGRSPDTRAAAAGPQGGVGMAFDVRSPDTREAGGLGGAIGVSFSTADLDLRSPDTRESAQLSGSASTGETTRVAGTNPPVVDMRSPDTRDAAVVLTAA